MRSLHRKHERSSFYKYMPASTAQIVLENLTLRWSSPVEFNDPFDVPREMAFDVNVQDIQKALVEKFISLINNPPKEIKSVHPDIQLIIQMLKSNEDSDLKDAVEDDLKKYLKENDRSSEGLLELQEIWRKWIPDFRILCLSENHDLASMWYHYADKYKGAVLEIACVDEMDSAWLAAEKVQYPTEKPHIYTADGWASLLTMPQPSALSKIMNTALFSKSPDWCYENEWRMSKSKRNGEAGTTSDYPIAPQEITSLYLGPMINAATKHKLIVAANKHDHIKIFETKIGLSRDFKFTEING